MGHEIQQNVLHLGAREQRGWAAHWGVGLRSTALWVAAGLHQGLPRMWQAASGAAERPHHPAGLWGQGRAEVRQGHQCADQDEAL